jgi:hypothetical protein
MSLSVEEIARLLTAAGNWSRLNRFRRTSKCEHPESEFFDFKRNQYALCRGNEHVRSE